MNILDPLKGNRLYSVFTGACPVCQEENMYREKNPYRVSRIFDMYERCPHCHTRIKMEPSFFFGAMYVSYAVGIAFAVAAFIVAYFFFRASLLTSFLIIIAVLVLFMPVIIRLSRNIWVNFFFSYDKKYRRT